MISEDEQREEQVYNLLKEEGFSSCAIYAIMGNIRVEAGKSFNYKQKQKSGGPGYGLFQMEYGKKEMKGKRDVYDEYLE